MAVKRVIAVMGIPGAGKSTLAGFLARELGRTLITTHELVEEVDPAALGRGDMADESLMRQAFVAKMAEFHDAELVVDGWPRTQAQSLLLPEDTQAVLLTCRIDIARDRLLRRARADDTPELIHKRITEQARLLAVDESGGWSFRLAGWEGSLNTSLRTADGVCRSVLRWLKGEKMQAFDG